MTPLFHKVDHFALQTHIKQLYLYCLCQLSANDFKNCQENGIKSVKWSGGHYSFNTLYTGSLLQIAQPEVSEAYHKKILKKRKMPRLGFKLRINFNINQKLHCFDFKVFFYYFKDGLKDCIRGPWKCRMGFKSNMNSNFLH